MASIISAGTSSGTALNFTGDTSGNLVLATNSGTTALTLNTSQNATFAGSVSAPNTFGFKNRIINGDMKIDQRNAGASISLPDGAVNYYFPTDRWACSRASGATATGQQSSTVPSGQGFINSLVITNGTGITVGSTGQGYVFQCIEGLNVADLMWGTANAKTITLSFWVQSSITGTHSGVFTNGSLNRTYAFTYSIPVANTWTQISITVAGDTTGTWLTTNGRGLFVIFNNGSGSTYLTSAGSWTAGNYYGATGSVALNSVTGSTWYITGVQLEVGSQATSFDYRDYGRELVMCQRYYEVISTQQYTVLAAYNGGNFLGCGNGSYAVTKRTTPTMTGTGSGGWAITGINLYSASGATTFGLYNGTPQTYSLIQARVAGNATPSNGSYYIFEGSTTFNFSAEL